MAWPCLNRKLLRTPYHQKMKAMKRRTHFWMYPREHFLSTKVWHGFTTKTMATKVFVNSKVVWILSMMKWTMIPQSGIGHLPFALLTSAIVWSLEHPLACNTQHSHSLPTIWVSALRPSPQSTWSVSLFPFSTVQISVNKCTSRWSCCYDWLGHHCLHIQTVSLLSQCQDDVLLNCLLCDSHVHLCCATHNILSLNGAACGHQEHPVQCLGNCLCRPPGLHGWTSRRWHRMYPEDIVEITAIILDPQSSTSDGTPLCHWCRVLCRPSSPPAFLTWRCTPGSATNRMQSDQDNTFARGGIPAAVAFCNCCCGTCGVWAWVSGHSQIAMVNARWDNFLQSTEKENWKNTAFSSFWLRVAWRGEVMIFDALASWQTKYNIKNQGVSVCKTASSKISYCLLWCSFVVLIAKERPTFRLVFYFMQETTFSAQTQIELVLKTYFPQIWNQYSTLNFLRGSSPIRPLGTGKA